MPIDYDWDEAGRRFSLVLSRDPVSGMGCASYTLYKIALGRAGEAKISSAARLKQIH
jgi:hypothetical protein